jgi:2-polyprenyl-6-methoxyphenol hydroxylase-like FAD-dependent oxidoreductase
MPRVVIVGAGPAGALLALLLAREGIDVDLLERQTDFEREFRGEILMPSGLEMFDRVGLADAFAAVPSRKVERLEAFRGGKRLFAVDVGSFLVDGARPRAVSQPGMLEMLASEGARHPGHRLVRGALVQGALVEDGRTVGVRARVGGAEREFRGDLVVGADGRFSVLRAGSRLREDRAPQSFDVVWCKVPGGVPGFEGGAVRVYLGDAHFAVVFPSHDDRLQIGWVIDKGSYGDVRARGVDAWLGDLAGHVSPDLADHLRAHRDRALHPFLLSVVCDRVERWTRPGLLLLGDAAHAMSPVGGQGLNMALRDAVVAANRLAPALAGGASAAGLDAAAAAVEADRIEETVAIQSRQARVPPLLFGSPWRSRLLFDVLAPILVKTGLLQRVFARNLRFFARGVSEVRYARGAAAPTSPS